MKRPAGALCEGVAKRPAAHASAASKPALLKPDYTAAGDEFASECLRQYFAKLPKESVQAVLGKINERLWTISSACTGTGMAEAAWYALVRCAGGKMSVDFSCEKVKYKRDFIHNVLGNKTGKSACIFTELAELGLGSGQCSVHQESCCVKRRSHVFVCGFSCKTLSKLYNGDVDDRSAILQNSTGTTGSTCHSALKHIKRARPGVIILENLDELAQEGSPNAEFLHYELSKLGYGGAARTMKSSDFLLPQNRVRAFLIFLHSETWDISIDQARTLCARIMEDTRIFEAPPLHLKSFLVKSNDPRLGQELLRRERACTGERSATSWRQFHGQWLRNSGMTPRDAIPDLEVRMSPWFGLLTSREKECLGYAIAHSNNKGTHMSSVDVAPRIDRICIGKDNLLPTLVPNQKTWLCEVSAAIGEPKYHNRLLLGYEALACQGFPMQWVDDVDDTNAPTDPSLSDLAGNAFSFPIILGIYLSFFKNVGSLKPDGFHDDAGSLDLLGSVLSLMDF